MKPLTLMFIVAIATIVVLNVSYSTKLSEKDFEIGQIKAGHMESMNLMKHRLEIANIEIKALHKQLIEAASVKVTLTWYHPESGGINTDGNPYRTATMTKPKVGRTIAISKELVRKGWLGKRVYIEGYGMFVAEDKMSSAIPGCRIDICAASKKIAMRNGKKYNVFCSVLSN